MREAQHEILAPMRPGDLQTDRQPPFVKPQGIEIAGNPQTLKGRLLRKSLSSAGRKASGLFFSSAIVGAGMGIVGVIRTSTSPKIPRMVRRASSISRRHRMYSCAETFAPDIMRRSVSA